MANCNSHLRFLAELLDLTSQGKPSLWRGNKTKPKKKYIHTHPCSFGALGIEIKHLGKTAHLWKQEFWHYTSRTVLVVVLNKQQSTTQINYLGAVTKEKQQLAFHKTSEAKKKGIKKNPNFVVFIVIIKQKYIQKPHRAKNPNRKILSKRVADILGYLPALIVSISHQ